VKLIQKPGVLYNAKQRNEMCRNEQRSEQLTAILRQFQDTHMNSLLIFKKKKKYDDFALPPV
jgi:hypothetical protein